MTGEVTHARHAPARQPVAGALRPLVGDEPAEREVRQPVAGVRDGLQRDPRRRVRGLDDAGMSDIRVRVECPLQEPQSAAARVRDGAAPAHLGQREGARAELAERRVGPLAGCADNHKLRVDALVDRGRHRHVHVVLRVGLQLVHDAQAEGQAMQLRGVGGVHLQRARRDLRLRRVRAVAQHQVPLDDVRVAVGARVALGVAKEVLGLLAAGGDDDDPGVLDREEMVQRDERRQARLAVASRQQDHDLAGAAGDGPEDAPLEGLDVEATRLREVLKRDGRRRHLDQSYRDSRISHMGWFTRAPVEDRNLTPPTDRRAGSGQRAGAAEVWFEQDGLDRGSGRAGR
jgi:hypothetical protein